MRLVAISVPLLIFAVLGPTEALGQLAGHNTRGDFGLQSGTQAPPGLYIVPMFYDYTAGLGIYAPTGDYTAGGDSNRVFGFGPEVTIPLAGKNKLFGFLNLRYFWETGARTTLEGNTFLATLTLPVPSIPLQ